MQQTPLMENVPSGGVIWPTNKQAVIVRTKPLLQLCKPCPCPVEASVCICTAAERGQL